MSTLLALLRRLAGSFRHSRSDEDLQAELNSHLEMAAEHEARQGHDSAAAARRARERAGSHAQTLDRLRDQRGLPWIDALRSDLRTGRRQIVRHPIASLSIVLSLGLAMGAALAAFRLVDAVLLRPLPVSDPARLFALKYTLLDSDQRQADRDDYDYPTYRRYVSRAAGQADVMLLGMAVRRMIQVGSAEPESAVQQFVSGNVFAGLGLQPAAGRLLGTADDTQPDGHPVAVLTYDFWQRRFGGDPAIAGRTFRMSGRVYEIVGVTAGAFTGTEPGAVTDFFVPSMMNPDALNAEGWDWFRIWVRPRPGVDVRQVQATLDAGFRADHVERARTFPPDTPKSQLDAFFNERLLLQPAGSGVSAIQKAFRQPLWILATLAALLVLVACANVANLLLARAMSRKIEMALRLSIGASRGRLIQLMLVESALLALLATAIGALFAWWAAPIVVSMLTTPDKPVRLILELDWRTLVTAASLTFVVTMLFGLAPAMRASAAPSLDALKEVRGQRSHRRLAHALVAAQTAFCVFLLFGASLFVGTLERLDRRPLGFVPEHLWHLTVEGTRERQAVEWAQLTAQLRDMPRVESAAVAGWAPLTGNRWRSTVIVAGREAPEEAPDWVSVVPGYLETMKMRLIEGRDFRANDQPPRQDEHRRPLPGVAIVNESFVRVYFDGRSPLGQQVVVRSSRAPMEIVGVAADAVYFSVREVNHPAVFIPLESRNGATILVRADDPSPEFAKRLQADVLRIAPDLHARQPVPFQALVTQQMIRERLLAALSTFFAGLGLAVALIGMYGVLNYSVTRERREIGLRIALGAGPRHIFSLLGIRLVGMVIVGAIAGLGIGIGLSHVVHALLFQIEPTDPSVLVGPLLALAAASVLAVIPPAIRAVRTDPARTIKTED